MTEFKFLIVAESQETLERFQEYIKYGELVLPQIIIDADCVNKCLKDGGPLRTLTISVRKEEDDSRETDLSIDKDIGAVRGRR